MKTVLTRYCLSQKSIAEAMRELLEAFRLPGEAQPIARITEVFAEHYISFKPGKSSARSRKQLLIVYMISSRNQRRRRCLCAGIFCHHVEHGSAQSAK
jgi:brefeldin A-resistance guanine nucleotide exchange factor 1